MPETDLIERLNERATMIGLRGNELSEALMREAATALSENIETINGQAMDLATLRARLASCEADRQQTVVDCTEALMDAERDFTAIMDAMMPGQARRLAREALAKARAVVAAPVPPVVGEKMVETLKDAGLTSPDGTMVHGPTAKVVAALASSVAKPCGVKALEAADRLRKNLEDYDADAAYELANEGERADLWTEIDVNTDDLRAVLSALSHPVQGWRSKAADDVLAERQRQVEAEGWTPEHDDKHTKGEIRKAAACYAAGHPIATLWPWGDEWWKYSSPRRSLVKAGALILAEIERLDRLPSAPAGGSSNE